MRILALCFLKIFWIFSRGMSYNYVEEGRPVASNGTTTQQPLSAWHVLRLRITSFHDPGEGIDSANWWPRLMADDPDSSFCRPKERMSKHEGHFLDAKLILATCVLTFYFNRP